MADGESQNFDTFSGSPAGKEKAQETDEQFSERYRQAQAAIKKIRQEEQRKQAQDNSLAGIIVKFLQDESRTPFFLLIARLVALNIPSDLILSILALIYAPAAEAIDAKLLHASEAQALIEKRDEHALFSRQEKDEIDAWTNGILRIARLEARKVLLTSRDIDETPNRGLVQLFALTLREFLESREHADVQLESLTLFGEAFFKKVFADLEKLTGQEYLLEGA